MFHHKYLFSCNKVIWCALVDEVWIGKAPHTISSLHIGHTSFVLAAVTEGPLFPFSSCTLELRSWIFSARGEAGNGKKEEASEFKDTVLSDGDSRFAVR